VLVVDDDPDIRMLFQSVLSRDFYVEVAEDGWGALRWLNKRQFDAVVLDMAMPNKSGLSVLTEIRTTKELKKTPVIVVSAVAPDNDLWRDVEHEWDAYMQKPVSVADLVDNVAAVARRSRVRTAAAAKKPAARGAAKKATPRKPAARAAGKKAAPKSTTSKKPAKATARAKKAAAPAKKAAARKRAR
jgi:DNA-binding response OmpR family regulator